MLILPKLCHPFFDRYTQMCNLFKKKKACLHKKLNIFCRLILSINTFFKNIWITYLELDILLRYFVVVGSLKQIAEKNKTNDVGKRKLCHKIVIPFLHNLNMETLAVREATSTNKIEQCLKITCATHTHTRNTCTFFWNKRSHNWSHNKRVMTKTKSMLYPADNGGCYPQQIMDLLSCLQ